MKKTTTFFFLLLWSAFINAQNLPNPYASIGKPAPLLATLSGGKYDEFLFKDSLVLINGDAVSRKTGELYCSREQNPELIARLEKESAEKFRFLSVDPIASAYPWYTPYQFAGNKPIVAIDMDGLEEVYVTTKQNNRTMIFTYTFDDIKNIVNGNCAKPRIHYDGGEAVSQFQGPNKKNEDFIFRGQLQAHENFIVKEAKKDKNVSFQGWGPLRPVPIPDPTVTRKSNIPASDIILTPAIFSNNKATNAGQDYLGNPAKKGSLGTFYVAQLNEIIDKVKNSDVKEIRITINYTMSYSAVSTDVNESIENGLINTKKYLQDNGLNKIKINISKNVTESSSGESRSDTKVEYK